MHSTLLAWQLCRRTWQLLAAAGLAAEGDAEAAAGLAAGVSAESFGTETVVTGAWTVGTWTAVLEEA